MPSYFLNSNKSFKAIIIRFENYLKFDYYKYSYFLLEYFTMYDKLKGNQNYTKNLQ